MNSGIVLFGLGLVVVLFVCPSVDALSANGRNVCRFSRIERYTAREKYKVKCGFLNWGRCTRYRQVSRTRRGYYNRCCSGWASSDNVHCSKAICHGNRPGTCPNGGICIRPGYCTCRSGFASPKCTDINECATRQGGCQHRCYNTHGSFRCGCNSGYGLLANKKSCKPVCWGQTPGTCANRGTCTRPNSCQCRPGYSLPRCSDINECRSNNGGCKQLCVNLPGTYRCKCRTGYGLLISDKKSCKPICNGPSIGRCQHGGTCLTPNVCACPLGFSTPKCDDINECNTNNGGCNQICTNSVGSFKCSCQAGYGLVGPNQCKPICFGSPPGSCPEGGRCVSPGRCSCKPGYGGSPCKDINECLRGNGGCSGTCTNTKGSFTCGCKPGYQLDADGKTCKAKCQNNPAGHCKNGGTCIEPNVCECRSGYSGTSCEDTNECLTSNGRCDQGCKNTLGSFRCTCRKGYRLAADGKRCSDIDECDERTSGCSNFCVNTPGSFHCNCPLGYTLGSDRLGCQDINECKNENGGCNQTCTNTDGSYQCSCRSGFLLDADKKACQDASDCGSKQFVWCWPQCQQSSRSCDCPTGHILHSNGVNCVDPCFNKPCQHRGRCTKASPDVTTYTCDCSNTGYEGIHCDTGIISLPGNVRVRAGVISDQVTVTAFPEQELILTAVSSNNVQVFPNKLFIRSPSTTASFKVLSPNSGKYNITFQISGKDADSFNSAISLGIISDDVFSRYQIPFKGLPEGNFFIEINLHGNDYRFTSTSQWYKLKTDPNIFFTKGIAFSSVGNLSLPLSLSGLEVNVNSNLSIGPVSSVRNSNSGSSVSGNVIRRTRQATFELSVNDINEFITQNSILNQVFAFLQPVLPSWLGFVLGNSSTEPFFFAQISQGSTVRKLPDCAGAPLFDDTVYHVVRFTHAIILTILTQEVYLPEVHDEQYCMIVDLNKDYGTTFIMMFPEKAAVLLEKIEVFKKLKENTGVRIYPNGFGISLFRKLNVRPVDSELQFWNGDETFKYPINPSATFWLSLDVGRVHNPNRAFDFSIAPVPFETYVGLPDLRKVLTHLFIDPWEVYLRTMGKPLEVTLHVNILNGFFNINLSSGNSIQYNIQAYGSVGGPAARTYCAPRANPPGLFTSVFVHADLLRNFPVIKDLVINGEADFFYRLDDVDIAKVPKPVDIIKAILTEIKQAGEELIKFVVEEIQTYIAAVAPVIRETIQQFRQHVQDLLQLVNQFLNGFNVTTLITNVADLVQNIVTSVNNLVQRVRELADQIRLMFEETLEDFLKFVEDKVSEIKNNTLTMVETLYKETVGIFKGPKTFGIRAYISITVLGLNLGFEGEFVKSDAHLRRCGDLVEIYDHMLGEPAWRAFGVIEASFFGGSGSFNNKLWGMFSAQRGYGLGLALASNSNNFVVQLHARINFFGGRAETDLFITNREIAARAQVNIWNIFTARLTIRAIVLVHISDWALRIRGEFIPGGDDSVQASLGDAIRKFVTRLADEAVKRINKAQEAVNNAKGKLTKAQKWLEDKKSAVDKANVVFDKAIAGLERAKQKLEAAKGPFKRALEKLKAAQRRVDRLCKIKKCSKICIPGIKFKMCKVWFVRIPCPVFTRCMIKLPNPLCLARNLACRILRGIAFLALEVAKIFVRIPMLVLDAAKLALSVAQVVVDKARIVLDVVKLALDVAKGLLEVAKGILTAANLALEVVKLAVRAVQYAINFIIKYGLQSIIDIGTCGFEIELSTRDLFEFEIFCEVNPFRLGMRTIRFRLNFRNILGSIWNAAKSLVKGFLNGLASLFGRRKREVDFMAFSKLHEAYRFRRQSSNVTFDDDIFKNISDPVKNNTILTDSTPESEIQFWKDQCNKFSPVMKFLRQSLEELQNVTFQLEESMETISTSASEASAIRDSILNVEVDDSGIDYDVAEEDFYVTREEVQNALKKANSTLQNDTLVKESKGAADYIVQGNEDAMNELNNIEILPLWKERMGNLTQELIQTDECSGFYDCVVWSFGELYQLLDSTDSQLIPGARETLPSLEEQFYGLFDNDTKTFLELKNISTDILDSLRLMNAEDIFCGTIPKITKGPTNTTAQSGDNVRLVCSADGVPNPSIFWYKDEELISVGNSLTLNDVEAQDSGKYVCVAGNHIANVSSDPATVRIVSSPKFLSPLPARRNVVQGDQLSVICNVSSIPKANVTWLFASDPTFNVKNATLVLRNIQQSQAGVYRCRATNNYGSATSGGMEVVILKGKPLSPKITLTFGFISKSPDVISDNQTLLQRTVSNVSLHMAFQEVSLFIANSSTELTADVKIKVNTPNFGQLSLTAGCRTASASCTPSECAVTYNANLLALQDSITRIQEVIQSDQPLFVTNGKLYYFNPSVVGVPEEAGICAPGYRVFDRRVCVDGGEPKNVRITRRYFFGRVAVVLLRWDVDPADKQGYLVELSNRRIKPPRTTRISTATFGFVTLSSDGPTRIRIRALRGSSLSSYAEITANFFSKVHI